MTCFNPRLPGGRRLSELRQKQPRGGFQSTPSGGKATRASARLSRGKIVSIHAFRGEGDPQPSVISRRVLCFNPRLPGGRRLSSSGRSTTRTRVSIHAFRGEGDQHDQRHAVYEQLFQSTPSGGKATADIALLRSAMTVSIHAFRGEGDSWGGLTRWSRFGFNPRLPGGRRRPGTAGRVMVRAFQSTPSGGKATEATG